MFLSYANTHINIYTIIRTDSVELNEAYIQTHTCIYEYIFICIYVLSVSQCLTFELSGLQ